MVSETVSRRRIALFVDLDNFVFGCSRYGLKVLPARLKERVKAKAAGELVCSAVFVDSSTIPVQERIAWFSEGFDIHDCPKLGDRTASGKDTVDQAIVGKMYELAGFLAGAVDEVILASQDRDFLRVTQRLRDQGKRVRLMLPMPYDAPELLQHADGAFFYSQGNDDGGVMARVSRLFRSGVFRSDEEAVEEAIESLRQIVHLLDKRWEINAKCHSFGYLLKLLQRTPEMRNRRLGEEEVKRCLRFLNGCRILIGKKEGSSKLAPGRDPRSANDGRRYYRLSPSHPFVAAVRSEMRRRSLSVESPPAAPAAAQPERRPAVPAADATVKPEPDRQSPPDSLPSIGASASDGRPPAEETEKKAVSPSAETSSAAAPEPRVPSGLERWTLRFHNWRGRRNAPPDGGAGNGEREAEAVNIDGLAAPELVNRND